MATYWLTRMIKIWFGYLIGTVCIDVIFNTLHNNLNPQFKRFVYRNDKVGELDLGDIPIDEYNERMEALKEMESYYASADMYSDLIKNWSPDD